ncbi:hypothetical protein DPMN_059467 [Dreissena polymorpha]|uniref:Uncharacterized protein n=1 Tax=Dreissena polymorpha TaxID=45954 RepID=A0A9D4C3J4_DREPO|nr:hypothetical protein DPMN_059467 [Dreissena polymorpha]
MILQRSLSSPPAPRWLSSGTDQGHAHERRASQRNGYIQARQHQSEKRPILQISKTQDLKVQLLQSDIKTLQSLTGCPLSYMVTYQGTQLILALEASTLAVLCHTSYRSWKKSTQLGKALAGLSPLSDVFVTDKLCQANVL